MIYGIIASEDENAVFEASEVPGVYSISAVTFNAARLTGTVSCTDNQYFGFAGWFKTLWETGTPGTPFTVDPEATYNTAHLGGYLEFALGPGTASYMGIDLFAEPPLAENTWQHFIGAIDISGGTVKKLYIDDVDIGGTRTGVAYFGSGFANIICNGKTIWVGDGDDGKFDGSMADVSIWPGVSLLTAGDIAEATRRLFIDANGNPVDPSVAIAALGAPAFMLSGNASSFPDNNLGTSGTLTVAAGYLSNATTHP